MSEGKQSTTARRRPKIPEPALRTPTPVVIDEAGVAVEPGGADLNGNALGGGVVSFEPTVVEIDATRSEREVIADNSRRKGRHLF